MLSCSLHVVTDKQRWWDYKLGWNKSDYGGIESIRLSPNNIWTPDILLYNRFALVAVVLTVALVVGVVLVAVGSFDDIVGLHADGDFLILNKDISQLFI